MAAAVIGDAVRIKRADVLDAESIYEQLGELEHPLPERAHLAREPVVASSPRRG
jgi:hypothetical protein